MVEWIAEWNFAERIIFSVIIPIIVGGLTTFIYHKVRTKHDRP